jgi:hypothetical protein
MALVLSLEAGGVAGNVDIEPLFVVIEVDAEGGFGHFRASQKSKVRRLYIHCPCVQIF